MKQLQDEWYAKLKADGFVDIEDCETSGFEYISPYEQVSATNLSKSRKRIREYCPDGRPLKKWTCVGYPREEELAIQEELEPMGSSFPDPKFKIDEELLNHPDFLSVCESSGKHRNNSMTSCEIAIVWSMHCNGLSNRSIAKELGKNECSIRRVMLKIRTWRDLL